MSLCAELAPTASNTPEAASTYACLCQRGGGSAPPLVACIGKLAQMTLRMSDNPGAASATMSATADQLGRKLRKLFAENDPNVVLERALLRKAGKATWGGNSSSDAGAAGTWPTMGYGWPRGQQRTVLQTSGGSSSSGTKVKVPCDGFRAVDAVKDGLDSVKAPCQVKLQLPAISSLCTLLESGKDIFMKTETIISQVDNIGKATNGLQKPDPLKQFLYNQVFGLDLECVLGIKLVDLVIKAGVAVPAYFAAVSLGAYTFCNQVEGNPLALPTGYELQLTPQMCMDGAFASKAFLETMADSKTG